MKKNIQVSFQVSYETELSDDELKNNVINAVTDTMQAVKGAEPIGLFVIEIEPGVGMFPKAPDESKFVSDIQMDRKREFERDLQADMRFAEQEQDYRSRR